MARIRSIKPEFCTSEQVVDCSPIARLLFVCMWCFCDDAGNHVASAKTLKMEVFPGDDITAAEVQSLVDELIRAGLIVEYLAEGRLYWHVTGWHHQKIDKPNYKHPPYNPEIRLPVDEHSTTTQLPVDEHSTPEWSGEEGKGRERIKTPSLSPARDATLADDFTPDDAGIRLAKSNGLDISTELEKFKAHYQANGESRADWKAQFRKWLLTSAQYKADVDKKSAQRPQARASPVVTASQAKAVENKRVADQMFRRGEYAEPKREIDITGSAVVLDGQAVRTDGSHVRPALDRVVGES